MARDEEREARAREIPVVDGLPEVPGIVAAMSLSPAVGAHLRGLANALLVEDFPGAALSRAERELVATAVSAGNDCFYCMDSHGAFARELLSRANADDADAVVEAIKGGGPTGLSARMTALLHVARAVQRNARELTREDVRRATDAGASDADVQLTVLIASAFCMYNRMVDGLRAKTPPSAEAYRARAVQIADHGYDDPRVASLPR